MYCFQKMLILAFEVIMQPPKHTFEITTFCLVLAHCGTVDREETYGRNYYCIVSSTYLNSLIGIFGRLSF